MALGFGTLQAADPVTQGSVQTAGWLRPSSGGCCTCPPGVWMPPQGSGSGSGTGSGSEQQPADQNQFASAQEAGSAAGSSPANMFGDIVGYTGRVSSSNPGHSASYVTIASVSGFKISDNDSPKPQDRIFITYNFYDNVNPNFSTNKTNVHRELFGFEKTILDGNASFGLRLPFDQVTGDGSGNNVGDLTITSKYAFMNNPENGNVVSGGFLITVPTGKSFSSGGSSINPVFLQPWLGFLLNPGDAYVHGFVGTIIPTDSSVPLLITTDVGLGYWMYRTELDDAILRGVAPTVEFHINNPLTHRYSSTSTDSVTLADQVDLTAGTVFMGRRGSQIGAAIGFPLTGPQPFSLEMIFSFNLKF
jgi:hypothetical protein